MVRPVLLAALALAACNPRPKGQVTELGHVGKVQAIAVRGDSLYLTVMRDEPDATGKPSMSGPVDIWRADRTGGDATKLVADLPPGVTAYADDTAYIAGTDGSVTAVDLATGDRRTVAELGNYLHAIAVTPDLVIVAAEREGVIRLRRADGSRVASPPGDAAVGTIDRLTTDGTRVAGASIATGHVIALDADGRAVTTGDPQNRPTCLGLTTTHTFWARDLDGHKSELVGIARGGTVVEPIAQLESSFPTCTAWDDRIYVADERAIRAITPGSAPVKVTNTGWVPALTATADGVYWVQMISDGWEIRFNRRAP